MRSQAISIVISLFVAACTDQPVEPSPDLTETDVAVQMGVDYSFSRPSLSGLHADGYTFVARYLSNDPGKDLSKAEANAIIAADMSVVSNWEASSTDSLSGYNQGVDDAKTANAEAAADGAPGTRPIYFSVDFDAAESQQATINAYFDGVASVIGRSRTGAYGGYWVIKRLFDAGKIAWGWQTYAWSGGNWDSRAQVRQVQNDILGGCCDKDEAVATDFGQWGHGEGKTDAVQLAFQANTGDLWTTGTAGTKNWKLGMMDGTSPAICQLATGGFEVAFQANTTSLWTVGDGGDKDWSLGMMTGSSPSITCLPSGGYEVAFEANTTSLWTVGTAGDKNWSLGMMSGTSPAIAAIASGGYEVAFEANTTSLWTVGTAGDRDWNLGMMAGTSPAIAGLASGGFEVAFEANTTSLWTVGDAGDKDWKLGMYRGTNPSITALANGGFEAAFQANTTSLWKAGDDGNGALNLGMKIGTSPAGI
ncbi:MAG TPA: glycoside hydrolase domain-containing protein [Kofleriaceae bacterium]|nr:glycoside hydrolase domain-containing protein [Kofleriaceae bacterium]